MMPRRGFGQTLVEDLVLDVAKRLRPMLTIERSLVMNTPAQRTIRVPVLTILIVIATSGPCLAATRESLDRSTRGFIDQATRGDTQGAFAAAQALGKPGDTALIAQLSSTRASLDSDGSQLKDPRRAVLIEESYLGACIHRTYAVRSSGAKRYWHVSYRNGTGGWRLSDVLLRR